MVKGITSPTFLHQADFDNQQDLRKNPDREPLGGSEMSTTRGKVTTVTAPVAFSPVSYATKNIAARSM